VRQRHQQARENLRGASPMTDQPNGRRKRRTQAVMRDEGPCFAKQDSNGQPKQQRVDNARKHEATWPN
jgi:hypothetical protein